MSWDPLQREILVALGHVVYAVDGGDAAPPAAARPVDAPVAALPGPEPLLHVLLRAAGRDAQDAEALALCRGMLASGGLRDPASRRALWPRLRALRAGTSR